MESRESSQKLEDRRNRLLRVIEDEFSSNAEFCRKMDISHNWVNYFKKSKQPPAIHDSILSSLYELKNVNPLWITNGVGAYKIYENDVDQSPFSRALDLIEQIEQQSDVVKEIPLPQGLELRISRLLTRLLERRFETGAE